MGLTAALEETPAPKVTKNDSATKPKEKPKEKVETTQVESTSGAMNEVSEVHMAFFGRRVHQEATLEAGQRSNSNPSVSIAVIYDRGEEISERHTLRHLRLLSLQICWLLQGTVPASHPLVSNDRQCHLKPPRIHPLSPSTHHMTLPHSNPLTHSLGVQGTPPPPQTPLTHPRTPMTHPLDFSQSNPLAHTPEPFALRVHKSPSVSRESSSVEAADHLLGQSVQETIYDNDFPDIEMLMDFDLSIPFNFAVN